MDEDDDPEFAAAATAKPPEDAVVFPPSKHENLHLLPLPPVPQSPQSSSSPSNLSSSSSYSSPSSSSLESFSSSSDADEEEGDGPRPSEHFPPEVPRQGSARVGWLRITIGLIRWKVLGNGKVRFLEGSGEGEGGRVFWSIGALAAVAAWIWWLYMRIRFQRRWSKLVRGIQERDENLSVTQERGKPRSDVAMALRETIFVRPSGNHHSFIPITTLDTNPCSTLPRRVVSAPTLSRGCQQINVRNRGRASGFKASALPDWPLMAVLVEHAEGQKDFYSYKSIWHLSDNAIKSVYTFYIMFTCWGCLFFGSTKDPYYDSEVYRKDGGDGTGNWIYEKQADMEESARAELWREELIEEIEQKVGGFKELEEAGKK